MLEKIVKLGCWAFFLIVFLLLQTCGGIFAPLPYASLAPFQGKVVDGETKQPIEGAVVLGLYYFTAYTIAGSNSYLEEAQETVTDANGEFKLPRTRRWFVLNRGYPEGKLVIFKPGFGLFPDDKRSEAVGENKSWPPAGKYVVYELPKFKTLEERKKAHIPSFGGIPYRYRKIYFDMFNKERKYLGFTPFPVPDED